MLTERLPLLNAAIDLINRIKSLDVKKKEREREQKESKKLL